MCGMCFNFIVPKQSSQVYPADMESNSAKSDNFSALKNIELYHK